LVLTDVNYSSGDSDEGSADEEEDNASYASYVFRSIHSALWNKEPGQ